jgi:hypothetical protein
MKKQNWHIRLGALILGTFAVFTLDSCVKNTLLDEESKDDEVVYSAFDYATTTSKNIGVNVKNMKDAAVPGVVVEIYFDSPVDTTGTIVATTSPVAKLLTSSTGHAETKLDIPSYLKEIYVVTRYPGYANPDTIANITGDLNFNIHPAGYGIAEE